VAVVAMRASVISPIVPPLLPRVAGQVAAGDPGMISPAGRPLPLPALISGRASSLVYGLAALDDRGRVADRVVMRALGWRAGLCLVIEETAGVLTIRTDPHGEHQVTGQVTCDYPLRCATGAA
jgi:hypothetical protein